MSYRTVVQWVAFASVVATAFASHAANKGACGEGVSESTPTAAQLQGGVFDPDGRPLAHVLVSAVPHGAPVHDHPTPRVYHAANEVCLVEMLKSMSAKSTSALTDEAGRFTLPLAEKGPHDVRLQGRGYELQDVSNVAIDQPFALHMQRGALVSGQITERGKPLAQVEVLFQPVGDDGRFPYVGYRVSTDAEGRYSISGLGQGEYLLEVQFDRAGHHYATARRLLVETSRELKLDIKVDEPNDDTQGVFHRWYVRQRGGGH